MQKLASAVLALFLVLLSLGDTVAAQGKYPELVGTWEVNIETCRPCTMVIAAIDKHGNVVGTHTSLYGEVTPLTGRIIEKKGGLWLIARAEYGKVTIETAFCEDESDGHYTIVAQMPVHHRVAYKKVASIP